MFRHHRRSLPALLLVFHLVVSGCSPQPIPKAQPIPKDQVDYFRALVNTQYWTTTAMNVHLVDNNNEEHAYLGTAGVLNEGHISFRDLAIAGGTSDLPTAAYVSAEVSDGLGGNIEVNIKVDATNMAALQDALPKMETSEQRVQRIEEEQAAEAARLKQEAARFQQAMKDAAMLQQKGKFRDALARLDSVRGTQSWSSKQDTLYEQLVKSEVRRIVQLCRVQDDEFTNVTFVFSGRDQAGREFRFYPYLGKDASGSWWFLRLTLVRDDWLFANRVMVKVGDSTLSTVVKESYSDDVTTEVLSGGSVYECVTFRKSDEGSDALFRAVANYSGASPLRVRVEGSEFYHEYSLSLGDVQAWRDLLFLYEHINEYTFSN